MTDRRREHIYPLHYLALFLGALALLGGALAATQFKYINALEDQVPIGALVFAVGLGLIAWIATKRLPSWLVAAGAFAALLGVSTMVGVSYVAAQERYDLWQRDRAVRQVCEGGPPVEAPPPPEDEAIRFFDRDAGHDLFLDSIRPHDWDQAHVPLYVSCAEHSNEVVEEADYVDESDGSTLTFERTRQHVDLWVVEVRTGRELLRTRLSGEMPGPFPARIGTGLESHIRGDEVPEPEVRAAARAAAGLEGS